MYTIVFDGGYAEGQAYGSFIIFNGFKPISIHMREQYDVDTSNRAEYFALMSALANLDQMDVEGELEIYGDSQLVINQLTGKWKAKHEIMKFYRDLCLGYLEKFDWKATWWPREHSVQFFQH